MRLNGLVIIAFEEDSGRRGALFLSHRVKDVPLCFPLVVSGLLHDAQSVELEKRFEKRVEKRSDAPVELAGQHRFFNVAPNRRVKSGVIFSTEP